METEGNWKPRTLRRSRVPWALSTALAALATIAAAQVGAQAGARPGTELGSRAPKPRISADHVSYGDRRKAQMAAYSRRHYGEREWRLSDPKVIVLHFTATNSYSAVWSTFDANAPSLGERPGVCAHYVVKRAGTIEELVRPSIRCRHTIGLNQVAIGIEMVQASGRGAAWADRRILGRRPQIRAALRLVRWLQARYGVRTREVIGHSMANDDPHFVDRRGWVNDHTDWLRRDVREFRRRLRR